MANRGAKSKEYRIQVTSVKQWLKEIEFEGLSIVEVYSTWFGPCQVILPTINKLMMGIDNSEAQIQWPVVHFLVRALCFHQTVRVARTIAPCASY